MSERANCSPSGRSLSPVLQHEATESISYSQTDGMLVHRRVIPCIKTPGWTDRYCEGISYVVIRKSQYCLKNWDFEIQRFNTTGYGKHTIRYQGPYIWSKLSKELRTSPTLAIFKTRIRKLDLSGLIDNNSSCCKLCKS